MEFVGVLNAGAQDGRAEAMEVAAGGVEDEQALGGKDPRVEIGEGLGEGAAGLVGGDEGIDRVGGAEEFGGAFEERGVEIVDDDAADRHGSSGSGWTRSASSSSRRAGKVT